MAIIAWGSCASNGCTQSANPNPTNATPISKIISKPVINVPGCPPIAEVMTAVVTHILVFEKLPELDGPGRPKEFYSRRVHDTCYRRPYYDAGLFVETWDDGPFYQHLASFPGFGIETTADTIGTAIGVAAVAGVAAHAITTNIRKRKLIKEHIEESVNHKNEKEGGGE